MKSVFYGVTAAFLVLPLVFGPERAGYGPTRCASPALVWLGDISYGIFCWHLLALEAVLRRSSTCEIFTGHFQDVFLLTCLATIAISAVSYYALERPFLRLEERRADSRSRSAAPIAIDATIKS